MIEVEMTRAEAIRIKKGMLYRELAEQVGCARAHLNLRMKGKGNMRHANLVKLADALGYDGDPEGLMETVTFREVPR